MTATQQIENRSEEIAMPHLASLSTSDVNRQRNQHARAASDLTLACTDRAIHQKMAMIYAQEYVRRQTLREVSPAQPSSDTIPDQLREINLRIDTARAQLRGLEQERQRLLEIELRRACRVTGAAMDQVLDGAALYHIQPARPEDDRGADTFRPADDLTQESSPELLHGFIAVQNVPARLNSERVSSLPADFVDEDPDGMA